ncbi:unnamed protein product [Rotaria magnacalcarata]
MKITPTPTPTPLRPIVSGMNAPTTKITKMLDRLIRQLFDQYVKQTTIIDGVHLIRRLDKYVSLGLLKPTTHLCTFDITDLYTMLPQEESIAILIQFLIRFNQTHVKGMTINAIESLARIVLTDNVFIYGNKYYRQVKGGAIGSPFTLTLANIFIWHWEQKLVEKQKASNELYSRYIDDIFLTSNDSIESLHDMLENANKYHLNIKLTHEIGSCVSFLDVQINNQDGNIITSVYHKEASEPYIVPFKSDHPRHIFENIITTALLRAIRYCSTLQTFNHEIRALKLMLLYNSYPPRYIYHYLKKFFQQLSVTSISILPILHDENEDILLRTKLLLKPTTSEHARASRIATTFDDKTQNISIDSLVYTKVHKKDNSTIFNCPIIIHYTHENQYAHYKSNIHKAWQESFHRTPVITTKLVVGSRNNPNLTKELWSKSMASTTTQGSYETDISTCCRNTSHSYLRICSITSFYVGTGGKDTKGQHTADDSSISCFALNLSVILSALTNNEI